MKQSTGLPPEAETGDAIVEAGGCNQEEVKDRRVMVKSTFAILGALVATFAVIWLLVANNLGLMQVFAPRFEQVRRETFEQSKAYRQGMIQELQNMQFQYEQASEEHKSALRSIILHRAADFDEYDLPSDLRAFIGQLRRAS